MPVKTGQEIALARSERHGQLASRGGPRVEGSRALRLEAFSPEVMKGLRGMASGWREKRGAFPWTEEDMTMQYLKAKSGGEALPGLAEDEMGGRVAYLDALAKTAGEEGWSGAAGGVPDDALLTRNMLRKKLLRPEEADLPMFSPLLGVGDTQGGYDARKKEKLALERAELERKEAEKRKKREAEGGVIGGGKMSGSF